MLSLKNRFSFKLIIVGAAIAMLAASCKTQKQTSIRENGSKENLSSSKKIAGRYADLMGVDKSEITNIKLYSFIDDWYGTPYRYGGKNKSGIDCSNFTSTLLKEVYSRSVHGSSASIFGQCKVISKNDLKEGDLVFFKIEQDNISHIGIYLQNNKFVHATTKKGVMIDDLDEAYYKKYFYKAGRLK